MQDVQKPGKWRMHYSHATWPHTTVRSISLSSPQGGNPQRRFRTMPPTHASYGSGLSRACGKSNWPRRLRRRPNLCTRGWNTIECNRPVATPTGGKTGETGTPSAGESACGFSLKGMTLAGALVWGGAVLLVELMNYASPDYGSSFLQMMGSV